MVAEHARNSATKREPCRRNVGAKAEGDVAGIVHAGRRKDPVAVIQLSARDRIAGTGNLASNPVVSGKEAFPKDHVVAFGQIGCERDIATTVDVPRFDIPSW